MADELAARNAAAAVAGRLGKSSRQDQAAELLSSCYRDICKNCNAEICKIFENICETCSAKGCNAEI